MGKVSQSKRSVGIDYLALTREDLRQYRQCKKRNLRISAAVFGILLPVMILYVYEIIRSDWPIILAAVLLAGYGMCCFGSYIVYFAGKPRGIRYGRISKKISVPNHYGRYSGSGYKFNVYFEDIHKSITNVIISPANRRRIIMRNDRVKVVKSRMGALYIMLVDQEEILAKDVREGKKE